jgi:hypothetical protein
MRKYLKTLLELPTYVKIILLVVLLFAVMEWKIGILHTKRSWKSGGTTVTYSDGTLRVRPRWGVVVSYAVDGNTGLNKIPKVRGRGAMKDYNIIAPPWRSVCDSITNVVIEPGVTYIGNGAFANDFLAMKSITIPNSVTEIGMGVFKDCMGLTSITLPESVTKIGYNTFPSAHHTKHFFWPGLHSITSLNPIPPEMDIQNVCVETFVYVPDGSVDAYRAADGWYGFPYIIPINGKTDDDPSLVRKCGRVYLCEGIGNYYGDYYNYDYSQEELLIGHSTRILMFYGIAFWLYLLLRFILKKKYHAESKKTKILSIIFAPILAFVIWYLWLWVWHFWEFSGYAGYGIGEKYLLPYYNYCGAITYGGIYLAVASIFYQVFRKKIKRQATIVILATLHIIIFASLMINGGL